MGQLIELIKTRPHWACFIIAGTFLFAGIYNCQSSHKVKDYIKTSGEVCNLEKVSVVRHRQRVTRYSFEVIWYSDGDGYVKRFDEQVHPKEKGPIDIWVSPDNQKITFNSAKNIAGEGVRNIMVGLPFGVAGIVIMYIRKNRQRS